MCGIVGYFGQKKTTEVLVEGLRQLEYRGYDSAGLALHNGKSLDLVRAEGKLAFLEEKLQQVSLKGQLGIGHTRWATHGVPSERNAHPHIVGGVCLVHNGIIENYAELRSELQSQGHSFQSDTDSEVVAHLISLEMKAGKKLFESCLSVEKKLIGAYAILAVSEQEPETMVAFKKGPPLIVGLGENEVVVASDVQAIIEHTDRVVYLEDDEVAAIQGAEVSFYDEKGQSLNKPVVHVNWSSSEKDKQGFKHYMLKEIYEQPRAVASVLDQYVDLKSMSVDLSALSEAPISAKEESLSLSDLSSFQRVFIVACGTSYYAAMYGEYLMEKLVRVPVEVDIASEFRYRDPVIPENSLMIVISQSGETADTLAVLRQAKEAGAKVLSICNTPASTIDREAHGHLYMHAGVEVGVASTKAFSSTLTVMNLLAICLARLAGKMTAAEEKHLVQNLMALPSHMESVLSYDAFFKEASEKLQNYRGFLYLGRGTNYPIALEGALKLKELAYMHAEGYAAGEMKHGPLALISDDMLVVVLNPKDHHYEKTLSNLQEAKARGGSIVSIGTGEDELLKEMSLEYLPLPSSHWMASGILSVITVQLLSYHVADVMGYDVDQPRNLAKSVTVE